MLKEEEGGREEEVGGVTLRRLRAEMTAVAEEWQRWRACELEVVRAAKDVGIAVSVYSCWLCRTCNNGAGKRHQMLWIEDKCREKEVDFTKDVIYMYYRDLVK